MKTALFSYQEIIEVIESKAVTGIILSASVIFINFSYPYAPQSTGSFFLSIQSLMTCYAYPALTIQFLTFFTIGLKGSSFNAKIGYRCNHQRDFFNYCLITIYSVSCAIRTGEFDNAKIGV